MELQDWRKEPRKNYSNEFKLRMVELASQPGACVAQIARENGVNDNVIFKWLRLWQNEGRVSRRLPVTTSSDTGVELLPVEITPDEQKEPVAAIAPSLSTSTQTRVSASSGFAPIFPDICYHLTHYKPAAADIPVASDNPAHYADAIRYNARTPLQGSLLPLTRLVWA